MGRRFVDCETELLGPYRQAPPIVCTAIGGALYQGSEEFAGVVMAGDSIVAHNAAFDLGCLLSDRPDSAADIFRAYRQDRVECTMVRQWLLDIAAGCFPQSYDLASLSRRVLERDLAKGEDTWRLRYGELRGIPISAWPREAVDYPLADVRACADLWDAQEIFAERGWLDDQHRQARAHFALRLTSAWGLQPDQRAVDAWERKVRGEYDEAARVLRAAGVLRADGSRDVKAVSARVSAAYGGDPPLTKAGRVKADAETCESAAERDPVLGVYGRFGQISALLSKDLPVLRSAVVHTRYGITENGRSSSQSPNVQNAGRSGGVRECFRPRPGFVFASADYTAGELCTFAQVCLDLFGESELAKVLNAGEDPHLALAAELLGIGYAEAARRLKEGDRVVKDARQFAKIPNFGLPGGLAAKTLVGHAKKKGGMIITEARATEVRDAWFRRWPEARRFFDFVGALTRHDGAKVTHLRSGRVRGGVGFTDACNGFFSGLLADAAKAALFDVVEACYSRPASPLWASRPVNFVHDEIVLEALEDRAADAAEELSRRMVEVAREWIPDVRIAAEPCLSRAWSKDAKAIRVDGRLVPWEPATP